MSGAMTSLVGTTLEEMAVFQALQTFGQRALYIALLVWLLHETRQLLLHGRCDYLTPVVRVAIGWLLLDQLPAIGAALETGVLYWTRDVLGAANHEQWTQTMNHVLTGSLRVNLLDVLTLFSLRAILVLGSSLLYLLMGIVKLLVIDILWPLVFGLVLVFGALAIPLGTLPGIGSLAGWLKNVVEVALWPAVFQTLVALQVSTFSELLEQVRHLDVVSVFSASFGKANASDASGVVGQLGLLMQFWALCWAYTFTTLLTPILSSWVIRSAPISAFGQMVAIRVAQLATYGMTRMAQTTFGAMVAAGATHRLAAGQRTDGRARRPFCAPGSAHCSARNGGRSDAADPHARRSTAVSAGSRRGR